MHEGKDPTIGRLFDESTRGLRTVSHAIPDDVAERLRSFAFAHRLSESAILEYAFLAFLQDADEAQLADVIREAR